MRTINRMMYVVIVVFSFAHVLHAQTPAQTSEQTAATETNEQKAERLKAEEATRLSVLTSEERVEQLKVELRAEEIKLAKQRDAVKKALREKDDPEMKQARKLIEQEEKEAARANHGAAVAFARAAVTGCSSPEEKAAIKINPGAVGAGAYTSHIYVTVKNPYPFPISIKNRGLVMVQDLCPGGSITLFEKMSGWASDFERVQFHYTAEGQFPDGAPAVQDSPFYYLSAQDMQNGQREQIPPTWIVQFQRIWVVK